MTKKLKDIEDTYKLLSEYKGNNPYILMLKRDVFVNKNENAIGDFQIEYIKNNINFQPITINKVIKITDWYGENRKEKWGTDFVPEKIKICSLIGETRTSYNCYVQYRQSVPPVMCFLPKNAVINNFLVKDYNNCVVDFERYDKLSTAINSNRKLYEHQKEAVKFLLTRKKCILALDMGYGKTASLIVSAIEGNFDSVLIVCPASIKTNWKKELMWYVPEKDITIIDSFNDKNKKELEELLGYGVGKSGKKKDELLEEAKNNGKWQNNRFVIVNYDIIDEFYKNKAWYNENAKQEMIDNSPLLKYIYNRKSCLIIDEAHKLSNNTSGRYKVIRSLIKRGNPDSVYLATGTPVTNNPLNLFYLLQLIENEVSGDINYYRERYCDAKQFPMKGEYEKWSNIYFKKVEKENWRQLTPEQRDELKEFVWDNCKKITTAKGAINLDELKERISHIYLRRVKEDLKHLPEKHCHELYYDLTSEQEKEYNRLWKEYEKAQLELDSEKELNKELLEGAIYRKYLSDQMVPNTIKLCNEILETEDKVVIACCYDDELYSLKEYYGDSAVIYNGKMSLKQKDKAIDEFNNNPNVKVFIGNIIASGVGITLTISKSLIFNNISFVSGDNKQMQDRIHRLTSTRDVDIYYQIFRDTQYQHMWEIVLRKQMISDNIIKKESEK